MAHGAEKLKREDQEELGGCGSRYSAQHPGEQQTNYKVREALHPTLLL